MVVNVGGREKRRDIEDRWPTQSDSGEQETIL